MVCREEALTLARRMIKDSVWKSTIIEGLGVTFPKTDAILEGAVVTAAPKEVMFIVNMKRALEFMLNSLDYPNNLSVLREFDKICGTGLIYGSGDLRKSDIIVTGSRYVPPIPEYSDVVRDIDALNTISDPLYRALSFFCYSAREQLFIDGNKRVAQLIMNKVLIENGIGMFCLDINRRSDFVTNLVNYYETAKPGGIFKFLMESIYYFD